MARKSKRRKRRQAVSVAFIIIVALLVLTVRLYDDIGVDRTPRDRFIVVRVIDGDSVELAGGDRLRLLAIDTPERGEKYYDDAKRLLDSLVMGKPVRIEYAKNRRDRYGRLLGYVYVDDTLFINRLILERGLGYLYLFRDNEVNSPRIKSMLAAQQSAITADDGLWSLTYEPEPYYVNLDGSFRLHRPSCSSVDDLRPGAYRRFETREEGLLLGLSPCRNCKP